MKLFVKFNVSLRGCSCSGCLGLNSETGRLAANEYFDINGTQSKPVLAAARRAVNYTVEASTGYGRHGHQDFDGLTTAQYRLGGLREGKTFYAGFHVPGNRLSGQQFTVKANCCNTSVCRHGAATRTAVAPRHRDHAEQRGACHEMSHRS